MKKGMKKGFTLVELVVTITIIAILSVASVATYVGITDNARKTMANNTSNEIMNLVRVQTSMDDGYFSIAEYGGLVLKEYDGQGESPTDIELFRLYLSSEMELADNIELTELCSNTYRDNYIKKIQFSSGSRDSQKYVFDFVNMTRIAYSKDIDFCPSISTTDLFEVEGNNP